MLDYVVTYEENHALYIPEAFFIKVDKSCATYLHGKNNVEQHTKEASKAAEHAGIKLIYGMANVQDGVYIDTPSNRTTIMEMLERFPWYKKPAIKLSVYAEKKLKLFEEFNIVLTLEEQNILGTLVSESRIDAFARNIFDKYL